MTSLTQPRFDKAKAILDKYREQLHSTGHISAGDFEHELRECWGIGYHELKDVIIDLSKRGHYKYLAARYMEQSNVPGVVSEFKKVLAGMYGIECYDASPDRKEKQEAFWQTMRQGTSGSVPAAARPTLERRRRQHLRRATWGTVSLAQPLALRARLATHCVAGPFPVPLRRTSERITRFSRRDCEC